MVLGGKGNDDTGVCPTAYQAARPPGPGPQGDIAETRRIAHDRGQVRQPRGLFTQAIECRPTGQVAGRRRVRGHRGRMAGRRPAHAGQAAPYRDARVRAARGGVRVHGLVFVGAALGQALAAGASHGVGRLRRVGVGAGKRAGRFRPGQGRGRGRGTGRAFFLVASFPYSNMRWVVALPGETSECVCQGLLWIFERMGMAPRVVVFDNATGVGHRRPDGTAARTRLFSLFCAHYGFEPWFRDPYSGHEKGSVENAVGFVRRNLMVPMPSAESFRAPARVWLDACERIAGSDHYRHGVPVRELFEAEKDHMPPLPGVRFDPCDWRSVKADKTGSVVIDANRYPAGPRWRSMRLQAGVRVFEIELRGPDGETITTLERIWGHSARTQVDPASLLAIIARKPRIWGESPIRNDFPETVRALLDRMDARVRADLLDDIRAVAADCGFAATVKAVETVIDAGRTIDRAAIGTCARRVLEGAGTEGGQDLKRYDKYMKEAE